MPETTIRVGEEMLHISVTVQKRPAVVPFSDILAKAEMVPDYDSNAPWKDCDGYEHEFVPIGRYELHVNATPGRSGDIQESRGYVSRPYREGGSGVIRLTKPEAWGNFDYFRKLGISKQVSFELTREEWARTIKQLVKWYENGWETYGAVCKYDGYESSVWGIIEPDRAYGKECMREQAEEVAAQMEVDGYTVTDKPPPERRMKNGYSRDGYRAEMKRKLYRAEMKRKLYLDCWDTEDARARRTAGKRCMGLRGRQQIGSYGAWLDSLAVKED